MDNQVRIADEDPLRRGRLPLQRRQTPVDAGTESNITSGPHDMHGLRLGAASPERQGGGGASRRTVLDDDDRQHPVGRRELTQASSNGPAS